MASSLESRMVQTGDRSALYDGKIWEPESERMCGMASVASIASVSGIGRS